MPIIFRPVEDPDILSMARIRAQNWQTEAFWTDRISRYLRGDHSPQKALVARVIFVAAEGWDSSLDIKQRDGSATVSCSGSMSAKTNAGSASVMNW